MTALELRKQRAALVSQMNEITVKGDWSSENREKWTKLDADQAKLKEQIDKKT